MFCCGEIGKHASHKRCDGKLPSLKGSNPFGRIKKLLTVRSKFDIFFLTKERKMENRKKYELKIIIDTENVDFLAETLTNYCQECFNKDNPCLICDNTDEHSYFKCPLGEIGCYDIKRKSVACLYIATDFLFYLHIL